MTIPKRHHVVIGDGATAAAFAESARVGPNDRLTVIGRDIGNLGRGLAYGDHPDDAPWRYAYLLNSPSAAVLPDFADWLTARWDEVARTMERRRPDWLGFGADHIAAADHAALFAPRAIFGDYLAHLARTGLDRHRANGVDLRLVSDDAIAIEPCDTGFRLLLSGGEQIIATDVDLAPGTPAMDMFCADAGPAAFPMVYGREEAIRERLTPGASVICIGANAAMLDVLRFLQSVMAEVDIRMTVISATGLRPEPLIWTRPRRPAVTPEIDARFDTCAALMDAVDREIARLRRDEGATMAELRPGFKSWASAEKLADLLPDRAERRRVTQALERRFRRGTHDTIADYHRLLKAGQITEVQGRAKGVTQSVGGATVVIGTNKGEVALEAPVIINCAGPGTRLALDPLSLSLLDLGWLNRTEDGSGLRVGAGLAIGPVGLRYLAPPVTEIGDAVMPFPLFDLGGLRAEVARANGIA